MNNNDFYHMLLSLTFIECDAYSVKHKVLLSSTVEHRGVCVCVQADNNLDVWYMSTKNSGLSIVGLKLTDCVCCYVYYIYIFS